MVNELCQRLVDSYLEALKSQFEAQPNEAGCFIIAPFFRPDRDHVEVGASLTQDGKIVLTDNSDTINYLFVHGLRVDQEELRKTVLLISATYRAGVAGIEIRPEVVRDEIRVVAPIDSAGPALRAILDTIMAVSHLVYRRRLITPSALGGRFDSLVRRFLDGKRISHSSIELEGNFITHRFSFYVNSRRKTIIQPLSARDEKDALRNAMILGFQWLDIKEKHLDYQRIGLLEDTGKKESYWEDEAIKIVQGLSNKVIRWSRREDLVELF